MQRHSQPRIVVSSSAIAESTVPEAMWQLELQRVLSKLDRIYVAWLRARPALLAWQSLQAMKAVVEEIAVSLLLVL